jgi:hypothetical protein
VLGASAVFEGATWLIALRAFRRQSKNADVLEAVQLSKDPTIFTVLIEDSAALTGLAIAAAGLAGAQALNHVYFENRSFSSSGSRWSLTQRRSATA